MLAFSPFQAEIETQSGYVTCPEVAQLGGGAWASTLFIQCCLYSVWKSVMQSVFAFLFLVDFTSLKSQTPERSAV